MPAKNKGTASSSATFSKAAFYRKRMTASPDGQKIWAALERSEILPQVVQNDAVAEQVQGVIEAFEKDRENFKMGLSPYSDFSVNDEPGRGEVNNAVIHRQQRKKLFDKLDNILKIYKQWTSDSLVPIAKDRTRDPLIGELTGLECEVSDRLDCINTLYQVYVETRATITEDDELNAYKQDILQNLKEHQAKVNAAGKRVLARFNDTTTQLEVNRILREFHAVAEGHKAAYENKVVGSNQIMESWEDLLPDDEVSYKIPDLTKTEVREKLLGTNVKLATPFTNEVQEIVQSPSHPKLHASRVAAAMLMYTNAAKKARAIVEANPSARPVIFDMGAGAFGGEKLLVLKQDSRNAKVCVHAAIPSVDGADPDRITRMRTNPTFMTWNFVPNTHVVTTNRVNWCTHRARDCTCMAHYTHVFVLCIHSAYYFTQADFQRIFQHTASFESLEHIPQVGQTIPVTEPEYLWEDSTKKSEVVKHGAFSRIVNSVREAVTWTKQVRLQPLRTAATTYQHADNGERLRRGGFHPNVWAGHVDRILETDSKMATFAAGVAAAGAVGGLIGAIGSSTLTSVAAAAQGALSSLALTTAAAAVAKWDSLQPTPLLPGWVGCDYSVETSIASSYETNDREQVCHIIRYCRVQRGTKLEPRVTESIQVEPNEVERVAAALVTAADTGRTERMMAATLLRDKLPVKVIKGTLRQAQRVADFLFPPAPDVQRPPWLVKGALATACLPFVSGISKSASSALVAALVPGRFYAPAKVTFLLWTTSPATVIYLLFVAPMHLLGLWALLFLLDRTLTA